MAELELLPTRIQSNSLMHYGAFDALACINPEIASLAYANKAGILTPEILPYVAHFRTLQTIDQLGVLEHIAQRAGIDADERKNQVVWSTKHSIAELRDRGETTRTIISEDAETSRTDMMCKAAVDINKLKYASQVEIIREQMDGAKYISDNELRATHIQTTALRDAIISGEQIRAEANKRISRDTLLARVVEAESTYAIEVAKAEAIRVEADAKLTTEITTEYLRTQANMYRIHLLHKAKMTELTLHREKRMLRTIGEITSKAFEVLKETNTKRAWYDIKTPLGDIKGEAGIE